MIDQDHYDLIRSRVQKYETRLTWAGKLRDAILSLARVHYCPCCQKRTAWKIWDHGELQDNLCDNCGFFVVFDENGKVHDMTMGDCS